MAIQDILIPQLGEGLQEVVVLSFNKKPGDFVKRDELLYSMETDKAVMEVESPYEGQLQEWLAEEGTIMPIGAPIARIESSITPSGKESEIASDVPHPQTMSEVVLIEPSHPEIQIPPRTRAHAKELGLSEHDLRQIPAPSGKLMPADIDAYLQAGSAGRPAPLTAEAAATDYLEKPLSPQQRLFVHRLKRSAQTVIPATMKHAVEWNGIADLVKTVRAAAESGGIPKPTEFLVLAYCVAQTISDHPKFRSTLPTDDTAREYPHLNLGIAVARPNNDLVTAVVPSADTLDFNNFLATAREKIKRARDGGDQAGSDTQILLTYMGTYGVVDAVPVLVSPAIAVIFIGSAYEQSGRALANLVLTFDHRLINGVEAAQFIQAVAEKAEKVKEWLNP